MVAVSQVQEESNRAAARFDKASSQYAAAKEMIRVTEEEMSNCMRGSDEEETSEDALLEVLNHATRKVRISVCGVVMIVCLQVVETEREKRASESEHRRVLDRCNAVLEEYRIIERKLRPHILKSRPYFEERWRSCQKLNVRPDISNPP